MSYLEQMAIVVSDYDEAIEFFVNRLGFDLVEDSPATTNDGRAKRWVVVRPPGGETALLLAQADGDRQRTVVGDQFAGRVGLFLRVEDFEASYSRMVEAGVTFVTEPRDEPYGRVAVFLDVSGNRWDLLGPEFAGALSLPRRDLPDVAPPVAHCRPPVSVGHIAGGFDRLGAGRNGPGIDRWPDRVPLHMPSHWQP